MDLHLQEMLLVWINSESLATHRLHYYNYYTLLIIMSHPYFLYTIGIDSNFMCGFYLICTEAKRGNFPSWLPHNIINFYCVRAETRSYDVIKVAYFFTACILRCRTLSAFSHNYILLFNYFLLA